MSKRRIRPTLVALLLVVLTVLVPRLSIVWGITALNLLIREHFPFSHFPMYSSFGKFSFYLYLADAKDDPIPTKQFRLSSSTLKKMYRSRLASTYPEASMEQLPSEALRRVGADIVAYLQQRLAGYRSGKVYPGLRLYQVNLRMDEAGLQEEVLLIGEGGDARSV